jgi:hypothetical protein
MSKSFYTPAATPPLLTHRTLEGECLLWFEIHRQNSFRNVFRDEQSSSRLAFPRYSDASFIADFCFERTTNFFGGTRGFTHKPSSKSLGWIIMMGTASDTSPESACIKSAEKKILYALFDNAVHQPYRRRAHPSPLIALFRSSHIISQSLILASGQTLLHVHPEICIEVKVKRHWFDHDRLERQTCSRSVRR